MANLQCLPVVGKTALVPQLLVKQRPSCVPPVRAIPGGEARLNAAAVEEVVDISDLVAAAISKAGIDMNISGLQHLSEEAKVRAEKCIAKDSKLS